MTVNSTKKICIFLSAILVCFSSFGMDGEATILGSIKNTAASTFNGINSGINGMIPVPSNLVISKTTMRGVVAASLLPVVVGGGAAILQYNGYDISLPEDKRVLAGAALLPVATYLFARNLTVTPQFKRHCDTHDNILKMYPIMKNQEKLTALLSENTQESNDELEEWLIANYRLQIGNNLCSRVVLQKEVNKLAVAIENELQRMRAMKKVGKEYGDGVCKAEIGEKYDKYPVGSAKHLKAAKNLVARLFARIIKFKEYGSDASRSLKDVGFLSNPGIFVSLAASPAIGNLITVLFQYILNLFGSARELPLQEPAGPAVVFLNNTVHQVKQAVEQAVEQVAEQN